MRHHGWEIWAAMTQPTPSGFPAFLTRCSMPRGLAPFSR
jgi:hypothetical protein